MTCMCRTSADTAHKVHCSMSLVWQQHACQQSRVDFVSRSGLQGRLDKRGPLHHGVCGLPVHVALLPSCFRLLELRLALLQPRFAGLQGPVQPPGLSESKAIST